MYCLEPFDGGRHRAIRCFCDCRRAADGKNSEQPVADELQYLATVPVDRIGLRVEESVEYRNHLLAREAVRARREATKVGRPQDSSQLFAGTAANLPGQYFRTGA